MKIQRVLYSLIFLFLSNLAFSSVQELFIYRDFGHKGDENQIRGVVRAMEKIRPQIQEFNVDEGEKLKTALAEAPQKPKPILLAVGEKTVLPFAQLLPIDQATTVHLCHMVTKGHKDLIGKVDFIVLPTHAVDEAFKGLLKGTRTQLIETIGVSPITDRSKLWSRLMKKEDGNFRVASAIRGSFWEEMRQRQKERCSCSQKKMHDNWRALWRASRGIS